jgi:hypothetical protein
MTIQKPELVAAASVKAMRVLVDETKGNPKALKRRLAELDVKADRILASLIFEILDWTDTTETGKVESWKHT